MKLLLVPNMECGDSEPYRMVVIQMQDPVRMVVPVCTQIGFV